MSQRDFLKAIISTKLNEITSDVSQITGKGDVNDIYLVTTGRRKLIARMHEEGELDRYKKEAWCIKESSRRGVHGPEVISVGTGNGYAYMLLSYLEGQAADEIASDSTDIWRTLGGYAKLIHSIPVRGFGENLSDMQNGNFKKWHDYLDYNIESLNPADKLLEMGLFDQEASSTIKKVFQSLAKKDLKFALNHGDISLKNTIVSPTGEISVFDWGSAHAHVAPHYDFGIILDFSLNTDSTEFGSFLNGYGLSRDQFNLMKEDIESLQLLEAVDKVRWAVDRRPERLDISRERAEKWLKIKLASESKTY